MSENDATDIVVAVGLTGDGVFPLTKGEAQRIGSAIKRCICEPPEKDFSDLVQVVLARAHQKHHVDMDELSPGLTPFLKAHMDTLKSSLAVVKLGENPLEWLEPDGQYIRTALATVHSLFLSWSKQLSPAFPDYETATFLAEHVVFPFHDNVLNAHDHVMEDGDRLLFDTRKCQIIFGVSPINGDRRFSMWYETLRDQLLGSPSAHLVVEIARREVDAQAQMDLAMEQEKMQGVDKMKARHRMGSLRCHWRAWVGECPSLERKSRSKRGGGESSGCTAAEADAETAERREELLKKLRQKRESCRNARR